MDAAIARRLTHGELAERLRKARLRLTRPRVRVYDLLCEAGGHLTADDVHLELQRRGAALPRATVFNVLRDLCECGAAMHAEAGSGSTYYEAAAKRHHHFVCRLCNRIVDVACTVGRKPCLTPAGLPRGYRVDEAQVIFRGHCAQCVAMLPGL